jgi:hypothetical protein
MQNAKLPSVFLNHNLQGEAWEGVFPKSPTFSDPFRVSHNSGKTGENHLRLETTYLKVKQLSHGLCLSSIL